MTRRVHTVPIAALDRVARALVPDQDVCPVCEGKGDVERFVSDHIYRDVPCGECHGRGYYEEV